MKVHTINTGYFKLDGGAMFGVVPKRIWNKLNPADDNNLCTWAMRCLLIEEDDRLILIDTGIGDKQSENFFSHYYLHGDDTLEKSIAALGFDKDNITDVLLTHLHFDHVGGAVKRREAELVPAFKNATYWSNEKHWQWAMTPNSREKASFLKENILPIQQSGQLKMINLNAPQLTKNIALRFINGHTEAMMLPVINYNGKVIVFMADLLPSVAHIPLPYIMAYDMFPLITLSEKESFLKEALLNNYKLFFEHDPHVECCTLGQSEKGIRAKDTFRLEELG